MKGSSNTLSMLRPFTGHFSTRVLREVANLTDRVTGQPILRFEQDVFLRDFIGFLGRMLAGDQGISPNMQQLKLHELLLYLGENYPGTLQKLRGMSQSGADDILIRQAVNANIDHPVSVEELAFLCNTSLSTFKRRFGKLYGTSPSKWLLEKRMLKAAKLLQQGDSTASEIYYELGYGELIQFCTIL